jgi:hypothetical protein
MVKTLAPWHAPASQFGYVTAIDNYGNPITVCTTRTEADARLIAAAPDLLDALESLVHLEVKGHALIDRLQFSDEGRALSEKIVRAIAKAKGDA